jgi:hypothetical protein
MSKTSSLDHDCLRAIFAQNPLPRQPRSAEG